MVILVIGGSGSGKSAFAEDLVCGMADVQNRYYLATMKIYDEEGRQKVERHRQLRRGKGFLTIEQPQDIGAAADRLGAGDNAVLLECLSNLAANEMFGEQGVPADEVVERIVRGIGRLRDRAKHLVIVTNNVFGDGVQYEGSTMEYMGILAEINRRLALMADEVTEVAAGLPIIIKGSQ